MDTVLSWYGPLDVIGCPSSILLAFDLILLGDGLFGWHQRNVGLADSGHNMLAFAALTVGSYIWEFLLLLPRGQGLRLPLYKQERVVKPIRAAHGFIGNIIISYFIFALNDDEIKSPSKFQLALLMVNTFVNMVALVYSLVLQKMFARYLLTVWLATFQDDWSWKTHNKRWWTLFKCFGGRTPDTAFQDELVLDARFKKWRRPGPRWIAMLMARFGLFGKLVD